MSEREYKPNSHKYKEEQKRLSEMKFDKVVRSGKVKTKKKGIGGKIFSNEDVGDIKSYLVDDVLIPGIKNTILDIIIDGASRIFGTKGRRSIYHRGGTKISYQDYYETQGGGGRKSSIATSQRSRFDLDDIVYETRIDAENVRDTMSDAIERYGFVTVAAMYDMADLPQPYTAEKYGWTSIVDSVIVPVRGGYIIKLPKAIPID